MPRIRVLSVGIFLLVLSFAASAKSIYRAIKGPWLTGPLLAPSAITEDPKQFDAEPYFFFTKNNAMPGIFTFSPTLSFTQGLAKGLDTEFIIPYAFNKAEERWYNHFQDITLILGIQAIKTNNNDWLPNLRIVLQETFPSGKFKNLDPTRFNTDSTGAGAYQTTLGTNFGQMFLLPNGKFLHLLLSLTYTLPSSVNVSGFNTYGGGLGAIGVVHPGAIFDADFAFEYTLNQQWVAAMDITYTTTEGSTFNGNPGITLTGAVSSVGTFNNQIVALAPALEYNISAGWGVIAGVWFSVYAHNALNFVSGVIAINYGS